MKQNSERRKQQPSGKTLVARGIRPDKRNRVSLGAACRVADNTSFDVYRTEQGAIILEPQISIPAAEVWLYRNKKALASVYRGLEELGKGETEAIGSFAEYADDET